VHILADVLIIHFMFNNFFSLENPAVVKKMWKNTVEPDRPQATVWLMRTACWITNTNTHSGYVILLACLVLLLAI